MNKLTSNYFYIKFKLIQFNEIEIIIVCSYNWLYFNLSFRNISNKIYRDCCEIGFVWEVNYNMSYLKYIDVVLFCLNLQLMMS